jgi:hypothetical protein
MLLTDLREIREMEKLPTAVIANNHIKVLPIFAQYNKIAVTPNMKTIFSRNETSWDPKTLKSESIPLRNKVLTIGSVLHFIK